MSSDGRTREEAKMPGQIVVEDFVGLALRLRDTAVTHEVPAEHRASLIADVVFQFASFLDERLGSSFHESIYGVLEAQAEALGQEPRPTAEFIAEMEIAFGKGRRMTNLLSGHLRNEQVLREALEFALGLRSLDELDASIDTDARFAKLMDRKAGIKALRFNAAANVDNPSWIDVPLEGSPYGTFEQSLAGLCKCILRVARQWT